METKFRYILSDLYQRVKEKKKNWHFHCLPSGHYCEFAVSAPVQCKAGTYMPYGVNQTSSALVGPGVHHLSYYFHPAAFQKV
jgi:hypothetical protein